MRRLFGHKEAALLELVALGWVGYSAPVAWAVWAALAVLYVATA